MIGALHNFGFSPSKNDYDFGQRMFETAPKFTEFQHMATITSEKPWFPLCLGE